MEEERVRAGYGAEKYAKLVALKDKWDPDNLFQGQSEHQTKPRDVRDSPSLSQEEANLDGREGPNVGTLRPAYLTHLYY
jgi:hypothetical protein